jgi:hypothetical protein
MKDRWSPSGLLIISYAVYLIWRSDRRLAKLSRMTAEDERWIAAYLANNRVES